jgi:hypothetical protein
MFTHSQILFSVLHTPVTVAKRSKACTVFARSEAGIVGKHERLVCVCVYSVLVLSCI